MHTVYSIALSVNQPKLSACAMWNSSGITIANSANVEINPFAVFIDIKNTLYLVDRTSNTVQIRPNGSTVFNNIFVSNLTLSIGFFVSISGDIYIDNGNSSHISKWAFNTTNNSMVMYVNRGCISLFIDVNDTLYCSINNGHQVIRMSLDRNNSTLAMAAGTGCPGSSSNMLNNPFGIYVDHNFDLYVADTENNRIQRFHYGELSGTTVAGKAAVSFSFTLNKPTSVILDADGYLFIVDSGTQRIIRSGPSGFKCVIGCSTSSCLLPNHMCNPVTAIFDYHGNFYITNTNKNGIQKFALSANFCSKF